MTPYRLAKNQKFLADNRSKYPYRYFVNSRRSPGPTWWSHVVQGYHPFISVPLGDEVVWGFTTQWDLEAFRMMVEWR